jgi:hypothetical protein
VIIIPSGECSRSTTPLPVDTDKYARLARTLCRLFELLGARCVARPADPTAELAWALRGYGDVPIDDDEDELPPLEPGEA